MVKIGYARVSSVGQTVDVQLDKLSPCEKIFQENMSGTNSYAVIGTRPLDQVLSTHCLP